MNPLRMTIETMRLGGHRGHSAGAPENTLSAFRKAFEYAGPLVTCETDLSITSDGELVLMHDKTVDRTTNGRGIIQKMTYSEVSSWTPEAGSARNLPENRFRVSEMRCSSPANSVSSISSN